VRVFASSGHFAFVLFYYIQYKLRKADRQNKPVTFRESAEGKKRKEKKDRESASLRSDAAGLFFVLKTERGCSLTAI
jgi:hypothetical protein